MVFTPDTELTRPTGEASAPHPFANSAVQPPAEQCFTLHGLKHRGVTDTKGKKAEKKEASAHKTDAILELYDHEVAVVELARPGEAERIL